MPQFMIEKTIRSGEIVTIDGDEAHHIVNVLRLKEGNWIVLTSGDGASFKAVITEAGKKSVTVKIGEVVPPVNLADITLAQAVIKFDRIESIIQKAVELGVSKVIPFVSERTVPKFSKDNASAKLERWNKIAITAAKQSGMPFKPEVLAPQSFLELVSSVPHTLKLMFYEGESARSLENYFAKNKKKGPTIVIIGPEGGFSESEVRAAVSQGFKTIKLGPLIMKVETAAIAGLALVQNYLGHFC